MSSIAFPPDDTTSSPSTRCATTRHGQLTPQAITARNRLNARKSTGPRTPAGKARSAQNARTHNLTAATPPPNLLTDPTYRQAKQELVDELRPTSPMQQVLVSQLAYLTWQLDQIPRLEHHLLTANPIAPPQDPGLSTQDYYNGETAQHLLENTPTPLTRLWDHHRRLLTRTQSVLRQLLGLQRHERDHPEGDATPESPRARRQRAADRAALDAELRRIHQDNQRKADEARRAPAPTCQHLPQPADTCHPAPAQNEPTASPADPPPPSPKGATDPDAQPASPPVEEGGGEGLDAPLAQHGATPRNTAQQSHRPAQNEPTPLSSPHLPPTP